jgi:hypothetical protein
MTLTDALESQLAAVTINPGIIDARMLQSSFGEAAGCYPTPEKARNCRRQGHPPGSFHHHAPAGIKRALIAPNFKNAKESYRSLVFDPLIRS